VSAVLFFIAAIGALAGAVGVVVIRNPFYSVLALVSHLIALAALFLLLRAEFVAAAQVIVYAGAVMVLYVFVVAYIGGADNPLHRPGSSLKFLAPLFGLAVAIELCIAMLGTALKGVSSKGAPYVAGFGTPQHIGKLFLTTYLFPFEVASLLLLVAAIGAVVLARRRRGLEPDLTFEAQLHVPRSVFTGTMAEAAGFREGAGTTTDAHEQTEPIGARTSPAGVGNSGEKGEGGW
jgi:NADH-quinone oxidoreductase subunit J